MSLLDNIKKEDGRVEELSLSVEDMEGKIEWEEAGDGKKDQEEVLQIKTPARGLPMGIKSLLLWENPINTGEVLCINLFFTWVFFTSGFPLITVLADFSLSVLLVNMGWVHIKASLDAVARRPVVHPYKDHLDNGLQLPKQDILEMMRVGVDWLERMLNASRDILFVKDTIYTALVALAIYIIAWLGTAIGTGRTLQLLLLTLFSVPVFYQHFQGYIDLYLGYTSSLILDGSNWMASHIPEGYQLSNIIETKKEK